MRSGFCSTPSRTDARARPPGAGCSTARSAAAPPSGERARVRSTHSLGTPRAIPVRANARDAFGPENLVEARFGARSTISRREQIAEQAPHPVGPARRTIRRRGRATALQNPATSSGCTISGRCRARSARGTSRRSRDSGARRHHAMRSLEAARLGCGFGGNSAPSSSLRADGRSHGSSIVGSPGDHRLAHGCGARTRTPALRTIPRAGTDLADSTAARAGGVAAAYSSSPPTPVSSEPPAARPRAGAGGSARWRATEPVRP